MRPPRDEATALELGYLCGNLHWRVRFADKRILIAMEGPEESYLARLQGGDDEMRSEADVVQA